MTEALQNIALMAVPILMAVTFHEFSHGWVANRLGDGTARQAGRLTLNPLKHLDIVGTLVFVMTQMIGWAKPVPVNMQNLKNPKRDMAWIALAGPVSNLFIAIVCMIIYKGFQAVDPVYLQYIAPALRHSYPPLDDLSLLYRITIPFYWMLIFSIQLNVALAVFNLIPLPPLDGGRILTGILPAQQAALFAQIERFGFLVLLLLVFSGALDTVVFPVIRGLLRFMLI